MNGLAAGGYTLVLPPGWTRIPLRSGTTEAITAVAERGSTSAGGELQERLRTAAASAEKSGGLDLYLPTEPLYGMVLADSFVVCEVSFGAVEPLNPALLVAALSSSDDAVPSASMASIGVRTESTAPADGSRGVPLASRRVDYVLPVPGDPDRWLSVAFSTLTAEEPTLR